MESSLSHGAMMLMLVMVMMIDDAVEEVERVRAL